MPADTLPFTDPLTAPAREAFFTDGRSRKVALWVYDSEESNAERIDDFIRQLELGGCSVRTLMLLPRPGFAPIKHKCDSYTTQDVSWTGRIKKDFVKYFLDQEFDYIFVLSTELHRSFIYLIKRCRAKSKIGPLLPGSNKWFDLSIGAAEGNFNLKQLTETTIHYTKSIYGNR